MHVWKVGDDKLHSFPNKRYKREWTAYLAGLTLCDLIGGIALHQYNNKCHLLAVNKRNESLSSSSKYFIVRFRSEAYILNLNLSPNYPA